MVTRRGDEGTGAKPAIRGEAKVIMALMTATLTAGTASRAEAARSLEGARGQVGQV